MPKTLEITPTEREVVQRWRLKNLIDAQYPLPLAEKLAAREDVDLHRAVELTLGGCSHQLAAQILL